MKVLISGGGTGGHVFPALAIADALKKINPQTEILFVGALGKLEMNKVPAAGYSIIGLPVRGIQRKWSLKNISVIYNLIKSLWMSFGIIRSFKPELVVGVGGYASGPVMQVASWMNKPVLIQEQNSYPGITNKLMAKAAKKICVAFNGMEQFFDKNKIVITGNPVRKDLIQKQNKSEAHLHFGLDPTKKTVGIFGGSLGARSINDAMLHLTNEFDKMDIQWLWQTGNLYFENLSQHLIAKKRNVKMLSFIDRMDYAYAACDIVVARAGALTLAELCVQNKPCILVPSPNVAEDHQTKNAKTLVSQGAARMISDAQLRNELLPQVMDLLNDEMACKEIQNNLQKLAKPDAANNIAIEIIKLIPTVDHEV
jgi:UDP-N-acetylglucosamine--N-acetylmuramyl-(pentapeptide) pyrophosphoryl-undecaprenol N-acetylglucosamine transferase